tara:strand:+ start:3653 stop:3931 length:279 start_codon:yes stop_codon:yes gene_type:complete
MGNMCVKKRTQIRYENTDKENLLWSFRDECCICMENPVQTAVLDCGHMNLCLRCANQLSGSQNTNLRKCPICRQDFKGFVTFSPNINYINGN